MTTIRVFIQGFRDGFTAPTCLSSGMTYPNPRLNEVYDRGANAGQFIRSPRRCEWRNI